MQQLEPQIQTVKIVIAKPLRINDNTLVLNANISTIAITFQRDNTNIILINPKCEDLTCEVLLHELNEIAISEIVDKCLSRIEVKPNNKIIANGCHFLNSLSLNQYNTLESEVKPFTQYIESDTLPKI